jgi:hypothetical protein
LSFHFSVTEPVAGSSAGKYEMQLPRQKHRNVQFIHDYWQFKAKYYKLGKMEGMNIDKVIYTMNYNMAAQNN